MKLIENIPHTLDVGLASRASIGVIVLASDYTIESEWRKIFHHLPGVALYHARIFNEDKITPQTLAAMQQRLTHTAQLITPATTLDVIAYGCTSATVTIGQEAVFAQLAKAAESAKFTTPATAAIAAFEAFDAEKIGILTPYAKPVNDLIANFFMSAGYDVPVFGSFNRNLDSEVARITPAAIEAAIAMLVDEQEVAALFVSCTSMRLIDECRKLEKKFSLPITSSNLAMAWHTLRLAGIDDRLPQFGSLFEKKLPGAPV